MGEVVNLNQYRKQRDRLERRKTAAANRVKFGRRKGDVAKAKRDQERDQAELDGKQLRDEPETDGAPEAG